MEKFANPFPAAVRGEPSSSSSHLHKRRVKYYKLNNVPDALSVSTRVRWWHHWAFDHSQEDLQRSGSAGQQEAGQPLEETRQHSSVKHADGFTNLTLTKGPDLWTKSVTTNCNNTDCTDDRQPLRQTLVFPETTRRHSTHSWFSLYLRESCFRNLLSHCYSYQCRTFSNCRMCKSLRPSSETFRIGSKCWCCENRVHYASYGRWSRKLQPYWLLTQVWRDGPVHGAVVNTFILLVFLW